MTRALLPLLLLATPAAALSPVEVFRSGDGTPYVEIFPDEGVALASNVPATYRVGAAAQPVTGDEILYLHDDCTAESVLLGQGTWSQGGGGVRREGVESFAGVTLAFRDAVVTFERAPASVWTRCRAQ